MKAWRVLLLAALAAFWIAPANAQSTGILVVSSCGNQTFKAGATVAPLTVDTTGKLCGVNAAGTGTQDVNIKQVGGNAVTTTVPVSGTVTASAGVGITPTDRTITSASGSSQQVMAANASRHSLTVVNTGNANCGVNPTGGTAAIGGAGTLTLVPNGSYTPHVPTLSAVTAICTAGQPLYADEN